MAIGTGRQRALESTKNVVMNGPTPYISLDKEFLRKAGIDPSDSEEIPDELTTTYLDGGQDDGYLIIDLKGQAPDGGRDGD